MSDSAVKLIFSRDKTVVQTESGKEIALSTHFSDGRKMTLDEFRDIYFTIMLGGIVIGEREND